MVIRDPINIQTIFAKAKRSGLVREGWLQKRGVYIRTWRSRYFQLFNDGTFIGFKGGIPQDGGLPENAFTVSNCTIHINPSDPVSFRVAFIDEEGTLDRLLRVLYIRERDGWVNAIIHVANSIRNPLPHTCGPSLNHFHRRNQSTSSVISMDARQPSQLQRPNSSNDLRLKTTSNDNQNNLSLANFEMVSVIGKGTYGRVLLARSRVTGNFVALKMVKKSLIAKNNESAKILSEANVLKNLRNPFLTKLEAAFQTPDLICFALEYIGGGELYFHLRREKKFSVARTKFYGAEIISGLGFLHTNGIIYRDLKPENLLLDTQGHIKITDFGMCKENISYGKKTGTFCGTPAYLSPEILEDDYYTRAVDWWCLGIVLYELMCGHVPFQDKDHNQLFLKIINEKVVFPSHIEQNAQAKSLLQGLLEKKPRNRLGGGTRDYFDICDHKFFQDIDFKKIYYKEIPAPFRPRMGSEFDVSNFSKDLTQSSMSMSPGGSFDHELIAAQFKHFNYVNPNA